MALKMRLRSGERLAINGAVVRNPGAKAIEIEVLNEATLLHERDIMMPEQADIPLKQLYFLIQSMHIENDGYAANHPTFVRLSSELFAQAYAAGDQAVCDRINELVVLIGDRDFVKALKKLQGDFGRPGDERQGAGQDRQG